MKKALAAAALVGLVIASVAALANVPDLPEGPRSMASRGARGSGAMMVEMGVVKSELDYLAQMIPHHEEAIASAEVLLSATERPEMRAFAQSIIETQSAEVAQMHEWLATWYPEEEPAIDYQPMMRNLEGLSGDELDQAFLEDMVGHHMEAVMMSQQLLAWDLAEHPEVAPFAAGIRDAQHAEIFQMRAWLRDWFGVSPMGGRI